MIKKYFLNILILIDQAVNVIFFGGSPDETISSRVGRNTELEGWRGKLCRFAEKVIDGILGKGHCKSKIEDADDWADEL